MPRKPSVESAPAGPRSPHRLRLSKHGSATVHYEASGVDIDAEVDSSAVEDIGRLVDVPSEQLPRLARQLRAILVGQALVIVDSDRHRGRHFTRIQLLSELENLASLPRGASPPPLPPWLIDELARIEAKRALGEDGIGPLALLNPSAKLVIKIRRLHRLAGERVDSSLQDADRLRSLGVDARRFVTATPETPRELLATKRALNPRKARIAMEVFALWTTTLGRPATVTKLMVAFADAIYRLCGFKMRSDAVKQQLVAVQRRLRA